jgi:hypothetical protein
MPLSPTSLLNKAKLRSLLAHLAQPNPSELPLSAVDRRKAQQWAIAASLLGDRSLTLEGSLAKTKGLYGLGLKYNARN